MPYFAVLAPILTAMAPDYDSETLSIVCPVCCAAITAKCLSKNPNGGMRWMDQPHAERYAAAHPAPPADPDPPPEIEGS